MNLITIDEIAAMLKLSRSHVRDKLIKRGDFPRPTLSLSQKNRRWSEPDIESWIQSQRTKIAR